MNEPTHATPTPLLPSSTKAVNFHISTLFSCTNRYTVLGYQLPAKSVSYLALQIIFSARPTVSRCLLQNKWVTLNSSQSALTQSCRFRSANQENNGIMD